MVVDHLDLIGVEAVDLVEPNYVADYVLRTVNLSLVVAYVFFLVVMEGSRKYLFTELRYPGF